MKLIFEMASKLFNTNLINNPVMFPVFKRLIVRYA
jgi:hypothetical protein